MPLRACLLSNAVLVYDAVVCLFVWVGEDAPEADETLGMQIAQIYAQSAGRAVQVSLVLPNATLMPREWLPDGSLMAPSWLPHGSLTAP